MDLLGFITIFCWSLFCFLISLVMVFLFISYIHYRRQRKAALLKNKNSNYKPFVSIIVPCYNEGPTLENCIRSLVDQTYSNFEVLIVDDGSKDNTVEVAKTLISKYKDQYNAADSQLATNQQYNAGNQLATNQPEKIRLLIKTNGGKGSALNYGIKNALGEIVVSLDADTVFLRDTLENLIFPFDGTDLVAVGGNVKVSNRGKFLTKHQTIEYISGLNIQRRTFAYLNCMQVIAGAIGAFKKDKVLAVGGYSSDTLVEDMDLTIELAKRGYKVDYNSDAIAYTEAPENLKDFIKQRYRWIYGSFQVLKKHREVILNPKFGTMGMIGMPYFLIFPWIDVLVSLVFVFSIVRTILVGDLFFFLFFFVATSLMQIGILAYALHIDNEDNKLSLISVVQSLWYTHLINLIKIKAAVDFARGTKTSWNKVGRLGKNVAVSAEKQQNGIIERLFRSFSKFS